MKADNRGLSRPKVSSIFSSIVIIMLACAPRAVAYFYQPSLYQHSRTAGGVDIGDPITADSGTYYLSMPMLNLGGLIPLQTTLSYHMNSGMGDKGFYLGFDHRMLYYAHPVISRGDTGDQHVFFKQTDGTYKISSGVRTVYAFKETTGYFYMMDPDLQRVFVFEKLAGNDHRLKWIIDRNNNRLTYEYDPDQLIPSAIYEGEGGVNDRRLAITTASIAYTVRINSVTERIYSSGSWQDGRTVNYNLLDNCPTPNLNTRCSAITDPAGNKTSLYHGVFGDGRYPVTSLTKPNGNTPFTQTIALKKMNMGDNWRVTAQTDAYDNVTNLTYGSSGGYNITETRPDGETATYYHYGEMAPPASLQDPTGKTASFTKSTGTIDNKIASVTDRMGGESSFTYHQQTGKLATLTNAAGSVLTNTYTEQTQNFTNPVNLEIVPFTFYNLTLINYPDATSEEFTYDPQGNILSKKDRAGATWSYTYNDQGQVLTMTSPSGGVTTFTYNADTTLASRIDADGVTETFAYDLYKRLHKITHPDATSIQTGYDLNDRITSVTDENNHTTTYTYDANGNLTVVTDPAGKTTQSGYDLLDRVNQATDRLGNSTTFGYDHMNRLVATTAPDAVSTTYVYNTLGWKTKTIRGGKTWQTGYDDEGIVLSQTTPLGQVSTVQSDTLGNVTGTTDPLLQTTTLARDSLGRVTGVTDPLGRTSTFSFDGRGALVEAALPGVGSASYTRNASGLLTGITDLLGSKWGLDYTVGGKNKTFTDPLGQTTHYEYDSRGRLATTTYPDGTTEGRTYDGTTHVTQLLYADSTTLQFGYDPLGQLATANNISLARNDEGKVTATTDADTTFGATYDSAGRLQTATYNNQFTVTYAYDAATGLLSSVTDSLTGGQTQFVYDNDDRLTGITRPNGVNATFTFDQAGRMTRLQEGTIIDLLYTFDAAGQITGLDLTAPLDPVTVITEATSDLVFNAAAQITTAGYAYDSRGRQTAAPGYTFTWDAASRLTGTGSATLTNNGLGDPVTRGAAGQTTHFYYNRAIDHNPIVAEKNDTTGQFSRYYIWTPSGRLLSMIDAADGNKVYSYHFDHVGNTLALTNQTGTVTDSYAYAPYGKILGHNGSSDQPFTFVGMWGVRQEGATGDLYQMRARYYDATTARFISRETVWPVPEKPLQLNPYQYANLNPISFVDVTGLASWAKGLLASNLFEYSVDAWKRGESPPTGSSVAKGSWDFESNTADATLDIPLLGRTPIYIMNGAAHCFVAEDSNNKVSNPIDLPNKPEQNIANWEGKDLHWEGARAILGADASTNDVKDLGDQHLRVFDVEAFLLAQIVTALATNNTADFLKFESLFLQVGRILGKRMTHLKLMKLIDLKRYQDQRGSWIYQHKGGKQ